MIEFHVYTVGCDTLQNANDASNKLSHEENMRIRWSPNTLIKSRLDMIIKQCTCLPTTMFFSTVHFCMRQYNSSLEIKLPCLCIIILAVITASCWPFVHKYRRWIGHKVYKCRWCKPLPNIILMQMLLFLPLRPLLKHANLNHIMRELTIRNIISQRIGWTGIASHHQTMCVSSCKKVHSHCGTKCFHKMT